MTFLCFRVKFLTECGRDSDSDLDVGACRPPVLVCVSLPVFTCACLLLPQIGDVLSDKYETCCVAAPEKQMCGLGCFLSN